MTGEAFVPVTGTRLDPDGYLGRRVEGNQRRLLDVDLEPLLAGLRARPGSHPWTGEHIGKWIHAATLTWRDTRDERIGRKLAGAVRALIATQEPDGYLGTYEPALRFGLHPGADWDVWTHKYCLIALLTYTSGPATTQRCGPQAAPATCSSRRLERAGAASWRPARTWGWRPRACSSRSSSCTATRATRGTSPSPSTSCARGMRTAGRGSARRCSRPGRVSEVGNGKAYEMLSNILGLVELAAATGEAGHLTAAVNAWEDVVGHHLYVTGTASFGEHFHRPGELPDSVSANMGETCVTVTWLQLTARLLELTGEARYAAELERTLFNHLAGAQAADGSAWSYYTPLDGYREHGSGVSCCVSSGPRNMALAPQCVMSRRAGELAINLLQGASAVVELGGVPVDVRIATAVPWAGGARVTFALDRPMTFGVRVRVPEWAQRFDGAAENGWLTIPARRWSDGDEIALDFDAGWRRVSGDGWNEGRVSLAWGPLVLAYARDRGVPAALDFLDPGAPPAIGPWTVRNAHAPGGRIETTLSPFADATGPCRVWLDATEPRPRLSAFDGAAEAQSSGDPRRASFNDYDAYSFAATEPGDAPAWFALTLDAPVSFRRVVFAHGRSLVHGGWFDTTEGKPLVQIRQAGEWVTVAALDAYPETDAERDGDLDAGQRFEVRLGATVRADGVGVIGRGAHGSYPPRRFATCALLQAFGERWSAVSTCRGRRCLRRP